MLKSLAYCGILFSGVGFIVLAMIHAQGESVDYLTDNISDADSRTAALAGEIADFHASTHNRGAQHDHA
jgi:hypothetical protein